MSVEDKLRGGFGKVKDRVKKAWEDLTEHKERKSAGSMESPKSSEWRKTDQEYPTDLDEP